MATNTGRNDAGEPGAGEERQPQPFRPQAEKLVTLSVWNMFAYMLLGSLAGLVSGLAAGAGLFTGLYNVGFFDAFSSFSKKDYLINALKLYYMVVAGGGMMAAGIGLGLRHAMVTGQTAIAGLTLSSALEQAIRDARGAASGRERSLQTLPADAIAEPLRVRVDELADYIEGYGIKRYFRRCVSTIAVDFIEEVAMDIATSGSQEKDAPALGKDAILKLRESVTDWVKKRSSRNALLVTVLFVTVPAIGAALFLAMPAVVSIVMHNLNK